MAAPTNAVLTSMPNVDNLVDANHELWSVTTHVLAPKGVNVEQFFADLSQGKMDPLAADTVKLQMSFVDLTKL